jgi:hypothetical protein
MSTPLTLEMLKEIVDTAWVDITDEGRQERRVLDYDELMKGISAVETRLLMEKFSLLVGRGIDDAFSIAKAMGVKTFYVNRGERLYPEAYIHFVITHIDPKAKNSGRFDKTYTVVDQQENLPGCLIISLKNGTNVISSILDFVRDR